MLFDKSHSFRYLWRCDFKPGAEYTKDLVLRDNILSKFRSIHTIVGVVIDITNKADEIDRLEKWMLFHDY